MVGYADLFRNRFKMNRRLTWVFTFSAITLVLYLAALFNALLPAVYGICGLGAILSVYQLVRYVTKKDTFRVPDFIALGMLLYLLAFGSVLFKSPLLHYDNFTYWATIVKFCTRMIACRPSRMRLSVIILILLVVRCLSILLQKSLVFQKAPC